ncbi:hypothetical protein TgHK011_004840 [Trichoderma gracile]|nr:hypothetical protein TgHK011_004840 [Trichoderma gracile]
MTLPYYLSLPQISHSPHSFTPQSICCMGLPEPRPFVVNIFLVSSSNRSHKPEPEIPRKSAQSDEPYLKAQPNEHIIRMNSSTVSNPYHECDPTANGLSDWQSLLLIHCLSNEERNMNQYIPDFHHHAPSHLHTPGEKSSRELVGPIEEEPEEVVGREC